MSSQGARCAFFGVLGDATPSTFYQNFETNFKLPAFSPSPKRNIRNLGRRITRDGVSQCMTTFTAHGKPATTPRLEVTVALELDEVRLTIVNEHGEQATITLSRTTARGVANEILHRLQQDDVKTSGKATRARNWYDYPPLQNLQVTCDAQAVQARVNTSEVPAGPHGGYVGNMDRVKGWHYHGDVVSPSDVKQESKQESK